MIPRPRKVRVLRPRGRVLPSVTWPRDHWERLRIVTEMLHCGLLWPDDARRLLEVRT